MRSAPGDNPSVAPRVSVIASAYRAERFLAGFFKSVSQQTVLNDIEVHVVANDPTETELAAFREAQRYLGRLLHVHQVPREPYGASWNRAVAASRGDIIAIWNVDDLRVPDSLERQVRCIDAGWDIAYGDFLISRSYGDVTATARVDTSSYAHRDLRQGMMLGPFFGVRRDVVEAAGPFDEQLRVAADFDFAIRALCHGKAGRADGILGFYLDEGSGLSTDAAGAQRVECAAVQLRYGLVNQLDLRLALQARHFDLSHVIASGHSHPIPELALSDFPLRGSKGDWLKCFARQPAHLGRGLLPPLERSLRNSGPRGERLLDRMRSLQARVRAT